MAGDTLSDLDLHAFVDGELDPARAEAVAARIEASPELTAAVMRLSEEKTRIGAMFGPLVDLPVPPRLVAATRPRPRLAPPMIAALALAASLLLVLGWSGLSQLRAGPADALVTAALAARDGTVGPATRIPAETLAEPAARDRALQTALDLPLKSPDLARAGYALVSIGTYGKGAAELSYRNGEGRIFTIYLERRAGDRFEIRERGREKICVWQNQDLSAVMVGEMSTSEMLRVATPTYADLTL